jgi:hypothetical protein
MHNIGIAGNNGGLVRLQLTNEVPHGRQPAALLHFIAQLLSFILTKILDAQFSKDFYIGYRPCLGNDDDAYVVRRSTSIQTDLVNTRMSSAQSFS